MGLLKFKNNKIFTYQESRKHQKFLREEVVDTLSELFKLYLDHKNNHQDSFKYGFEFEINLVEKNNVLKLGKKTDFDKIFKDKKKCFEIVPEYANFMIEIVPLFPFTKFFHLEKLKYCINYINTEINNSLKNHNLRIFSIASLMNLGSPDLYLEDDKVLKIEERKSNNKSSKSDFFYDDHINQHPRFLTLTKNVRKKRGEKPNIIIPIYKDVFTKNSHQYEKFNGFIHLDAFGFGMGNNSLQVTYSTKDLNGSRFLYDQLHVISFIFMSLTASTAVYKKYLLNSDTRWRFIENSTDDRNPKDRKILSKGRYANVSHFISNDKRMKHKYNDNQYFINKSFKKKLKISLKKKNIKLDNRLLNHFAFLFIRENLIFFEEYLNIKGSEDVTLYETIQSTNWNNVRLKAPESFTSNRGWLVEFRPMENVLTDKEKVVFITLSTLFVRMINDENFKLNFYIPATLCDINFNRSHNIDAVTKEKFYFRNSIFGNSKDDSYDLYTMNEIFKGKGKFIGLNNLIKKYLEFTKEITESEKENILDMLNFINYRVENKLPTMAKYIRDFVREHKDYKFNSIVHNSILKDLYDDLINLQINKNPEKEKILFGEYLKNLL